MGKNTEQSGFTLLELSIVLVIIGLITGSILVGNDLINTATLRAQISQIEKYNTAVTTFRLKYNALPGDIADAQATQAGLAARGTMGYPDGFAGAGDGNGLIEGIINVNVANSNCGTCLAAGEPVFFWNDLSYGNGLNVSLIDGSFNPSGLIGPGGDPDPAITGSAIEQWVPKGKISGNFVYVWSENGFNWFGLSLVTQLHFAGLYSSPGITTLQAYNMDTKLDDGIPTTGSVQAVYINFVSKVLAPSVGVSGGSSASCYDTITGRYSTAQDSGNDKNCALSFRWYQ